jgi:zinc protease
MFMQKAVVTILTVIFHLFFSIQLYAFEGESSKHILDNGLIVLVREMPASPVVAVYALVKTGSATEGEYLGSGISHFLEHMLFKGTAKRGVGEIAAQIQAVGGTINALTGMDYTMYTITVPFEAFDAAIDVLADMLMNSVMDPEEMEKEREVIFGEMRLYEDNPDRYLSRLVLRNVYVRHPYSHPIIGYEELLAKVTRQDLLDYYHRHYAPHNMILSIAGHTQTEAILPKIQQAFKDFKPQRRLSRNLPVEPPQISPRRYEEEYPTQLTRLSMTFQGVSLLDRDLYALDVLAMILGQGESSRLYLNVYKKKGLAHQISSSNFTPADQGFFEIDSLLEEDNAPQAIGAVLGEIELIKKDGVKKEELEKAKRQVLTEHVFRYQRASHVSYSQAVDEAFTGDYLFSEKYTEAVRRIHNEDIKRVAKQYLVDSALTIVVLKPKSEEKDAVMDKRKVVAVEIQRHVLDNGLTVLLKEDPTLPLVCIRLSLQGGVRQEEAALNGLSFMTAQVWTKGTRSKNAREIAEQTESLGMTLEAFSGKNSLGLTLECLSGDWDTAVGLLEDLMKNPAFPEAEIVKVKEDMKTVVRRREDDISTVTGLAMRGLLFTRHPLRLNEYGTRETIDRITRQDIADFYARLAVPKNMVLSVFGDIEEGKILAILQKRFGSLPERDVSLKSVREEPPPEPREKTLSMDKEQAMVMFGFHGVEVGHKDRYGLEVLTAVLGSSFSGRLFNSIREQSGQAYALGGNFEPSLDAGLIYFYVLTTDEQAVAVNKILRTDIQELQSVKVSGAELQSIKAYLKGTFQAALETNASLSLTSSLDELYGLGYRYYQHYGDGIEAVTAEDIQRMARQYLDLERVVIVTTLPGKNAMKKTE